MSKLEVILCESLENSLAEAIEKCPHDRLFILTDEHTHRLCLPQLQNIPAIQMQLKSLSVQKMYTKIWKLWLPYGKP